MKLHLFFQIYFVFLFLIVVYVSDLHAQANRPADLAEVFDTRTVWRGQADLWAPPGTLYPAIYYEMVLRPAVGNTIEGVINQRFGSGHRRFSFSGTFQNGVLKGSTTGFKDIAPLDRDVNPVFRTEPNLRQCKNFKLEAYVYPITEYSFDWGKNPDQAPTLIGSVMDWEMLGNNCSVRPKVLRQSDSVVAFIGGFNDESVKKRVYKNYQEKAPSEQSVKYFGARENGRIIQYIRCELSANPFARIALVGHSWGGDTALNVAEEISRMYPTVTLDLVVTLDPVKQFESNPHEIKDRRGRIIKSAALPKKIERTKPKNTLKWFNVFINPNDPNVPDEGGYAIAPPAIKGSGHYGSQRAAGINYLMAVNHCKPDLMFTNNTQPGERNMESYVLEMNKANMGWANLAYKVDFSDAVQRDCRANLSEQESKFFDKPILPIDKYRSDLPLTEDVPSEEFVDVSKKKEAGEEEYRFELNSKKTTSLQLEVGDRLRVFAGGTIILGFIAGRSTPEGITGFEDYSIFRDWPHGILLINIDDGTKNGLWDPCGSGCTGVMKKAGKLNLVINDRDSANNEGGYKVTVLIKRKNKTNK